MTRSRRCQALCNLVETALRAQAFLVHADIRSRLEEWKRNCYGREAGLWPIGPYRLAKAFRVWALYVISIRDQSVRVALEVIFN